MLVLSRRSNEKLCFPQLDITIHFLRVQSGTVKVGVDAPREIHIIRDEVDPSSEASPRSQQTAVHLPSEVRHAIRNELHTITLGVHLFKEQMRMGLTAEADETFRSIQESLRELDRHQVLQRPDASCHPPTSQYSCAATPPSVRGPAD